MSLKLVDMVKVLGFGPWRREVHSLSLEEEKLFMNLEAFSLTYRKHASI